MKQDLAKSPGGNPRLDSWKQIASYLGCEERTAKRWEGTRGLPIHRLPGGRSGVFAYVREIEEWQKQSATRSSRNIPESPAETKLEPPPPTFEPEPAPPTHGHLTFESFQNYVPLALLAAALISSPFFLARTFASSRSHTPSPAGSVAHVTAHVPLKEAEDLYLNGRYFWNKRTARDLETALGLFKQAVQRDPQYASAYVGLADTYSLLVEFAALPPSEAYPPAIAAARHAVALDPSLPEAHRSLAFSSFYWSWDRKLSEREFRKAIEIDPRDATSHHWFANTLMSSQRLQEALDEIEKARRLDPTAISILADRAHILSAMGHKQEAREALTEIEKVDPSFLSVHWYLADIHHSEQDYRGYLEELKRIAAITHREVDAKIYASGEKGFASNGKRGLFNALATEELSLFHQGNVPAFDVASALAEAGKSKQAIQYLKLAYLSRDTQFLVLKAPNTLPMLKSDPEFQELAEKSIEPYQEHSQMAELSRLPK